MKYIILIMGVFTLVGCNMNRSNTIYLSFNQIANIIEDEKLQVNLTLYNQSSASEWYHYEKRITIAYEGVILEKKLTEKNIFYSELEIANPTKLLYLKQGSDNVYNNIGVDVFETYNFYSTYYDISIEVDSNPKKIESYSTEYRSVKEKPRLDFYQPHISEYKVYPLDDDTIENIMSSYTFEELVNSEKLLNEDIVRLKHLKPEQINKLIIIHSKKDFNKLES